MHLQEIHLLILNYNKEACICQILTLYYTCAVADTVSSSSIKSADSTAGSNSIKSVDSTIDSNSIKRADSIISSNSKKRAGSTIGISSIILEKQKSFGFIFDFLELYFTYNSLIIL